MLDDGTPGDQSAAPALSRPLRAQTALRRAGRV